jgi:hypothetical protein
VNLTTEQLARLRGLVAADSASDDARPDEVAQLVAAGVPPESAPELLRSVRRAFDAGLGSTCPDEAGTQGPPTDPILAEFYHAGRKAGNDLLARSRRDRLLGFLFVAVVAAGLLAALIWKYAG